MNCQIVKWILFFAGVICCFDVVSVCVSNVVHKWKLAPTSNASPLTINNKHETTIQIENQIKVHDMPLRTLASFLANGHLIERLANSYVMRRLAQLTHYTYIKGTQAGQKSLDKFTQAKEAEHIQGSGSQSSFTAARVMRNFYKNVQKEIEKKNMK